MKVRFERINVSETKRPAMRGRRIALVLVIGLVPLALAPAAFASSSGSNTSTVNLEAPTVRSITVTSPASNVLSFCRDNTTGTDTTGLAIPDGECITPDADTGFITIANGPAAGHIYVNGGDAVPSTGGKDWTLPAEASDASNSDPAVGPDVYAEETFNLRNPGTLMTNTPSCDFAFADGSQCTAAASQMGTEGLAVFAPTSSTAAFPSFTITTTWTAVP